MPESGGRLRESASLRSGLAWCVHLCLMEGMARRALRIQVLCSFSIGWWACAPQAAEGVKATQKKPEKEVSVYAVEWQCPAAPGIGCGSHAKPILLQLERDSSVSEAWLNRPGTM